MTATAGIDEAMNRLARLLRDFPWYHRTTAVFMGEHGAPTIRVWAEGEARPAGVPETFLGWPVHWCRVTRKDPCPFGSVQRGCGGKKK